MITGELKSQVDKVWEAFWTGGISNPLTVIEQFTYLLFIRRMDELQKNDESNHNKYGIPRKVFHFTPEEQNLRWSSLTQMEPEEMFEQFTKTTAERPVTVFDHMKNLNNAGVFAQNMKGATFMIPTPRLLDQVVQLISAIKMDDRDTKGDLYEYLLSKLASAGTNGQFRTPRHIIRMMVDMMQPKKDDTICDPSCGTAGFLVVGGEYLHEKHPDWFFEEEFRTHFNSKMFTGMEFDPTMLRIAAMNLQLHGIEEPQLIGKDALSEANKAASEQYSLILANPPFKGSLDYDAVESSILQTVKTKKTELLFLGLILRLLQPGGRVAVIVPDGVLFGSSNAHKQIRKEIVDNHQLQAIVSMPSGVFKPYAGVSTAVMIFTKTGRGGTDQVWFYDMKADGYSLDDKRTELLPPLEGDRGGGYTVLSPEDHVKNNIPDIIKRYSSLEEGGLEVDRKRTDQSFLVPVSEIRANDYDLSINKYKEVVYEAVEYEKPDVLIAQIKQLDQERHEVLNLLEKMLKQ